MIDYDAGRNGGRMDNADSSSWLAGQLPPQTDTPTWGWLAVGSGAADLPLLDMLYMLDMSEATYLPTIEYPV